MKDASTPRQQALVEREDTELDALRARAASPSSPRAHSHLRSYSPENLPPSPQAESPAAVVNVVLADQLWPPADEISEIQPENDADVMGLGAEAQGGHISLASSLTVQRPVKRDVRRAASKVPGVYPPPNRLMMPQALDMSRLTTQLVEKQIREQRAADQRRYAERVGRTHERLELLDRSWTVRQTSLRANCEHKVATMPANTYSSTRLEEAGTQALRCAPGTVAPTHTPTRGKQLMNAGRAHPQFSGAADTATALSRLSSPEPWLFDGEPADPLSLRFT